MFLVAAENDQLVIIFKLLKANNALRADLVFLNFVMCSVSFKVNFLKLIKVSIKLPWFQLNLNFFHVSLKVYDTSDEISPQSGSLLFAVLLELMHRIILRANLLLSCESHHFNIPLSMLPLIFKVAVVCFIWWKYFLSVALLWQNSGYSLYKHYKQVECLS